MFASNLLRGVSVKILNIAVIAACCILTACVSSGVKVDQSKLSSLKPGVTTCTEAVATLGKPTNVSIQSDGKKSYQYVYIHAQANAASFIPYVGLFVGGTNSEDTTFTMNCDRNDKVTTYSSTQGSNSTGTGIINGQRQ